MAWKYNNATGRLTRNGRVIFERGYAGTTGLKGVISLGLVPAGKYEVDEPKRSPLTGAYVLDLRPDGHHAHGRSHFQIHGDSSANPGNMTKGSILLPLEVRKKIWLSRDHEFEVSGPSWAVLIPR